MIWENKNFPLVELAKPGFLIDCIPFCHIDKNGINTLILITILSVIIDKFSIRIH